MKTEKAIDFLFDQTGKLRTTRVRHEAMVNALSDIKTALRQAREDSVNEGKLVQYYMRSNVKLSGEINELRDRLKHEEDRAAAFAHRNIELANEIEEAKRVFQKDIKVLENDNDRFRDENRLLKSKVKSKTRFRNVFGV